MVAYYGCHKKLQFWLKFLVLSNVFWNNFMLSRPKCLLNKEPLLNPLLTFICHFFEWWPGSELLWSIFICLPGDLLRDCLLTFWFFIVNCTSFSGNYIESSSSKEEDSIVFSCICLSLLISVFVVITGLEIRSFTGCSPEKLKYIDLNIEMILLFLLIVKKNCKWNMSDKLRDCFPTQCFGNNYMFLKQ